MPQIMSYGLVAIIALPAIGLIIYSIFVQKKGSMFKVKSSVIKSGGWENKMMLFFFFLAILITVFFYQFGNSSLALISGALLVGIPGIIYGMEKLRQRRLIENIPTSKIRSAAVGLVEINGKVASTKEALLTSPINKKKCVHYTVRVEEYRKQGKNSKWVQIYHEARGDYIYLDDGTGTMLVHLDEPEFDLDKDYYVTTSRWYNDEKLNEFCEEHSFSGRRGLFARRRRFTEIVIEPDDELYVMGTAKINPNKESTGSPLFISRGDEEKFFLVSEHGENKIMSKLSSRAFLGIWGGAILVVVGSSYLVYYLGFF